LLNSELLHRLKALIPTLPSTKGSKRPDLPNGHISQTKPKFVMRFSVPTHMPHQYLRGITTKAKNIYHIFGQISLGTPKLDEKERVR